MEGSSLQRNILLQWRSKKERSMDRIIQANIDRFKLLLKTETDQTKRAMAERLLAEEEAKQKQAPNPQKKEA